jgi:DNA-binding SARP family transcriptional activator
MWRRSSPTRRRGLALWNDGRRREATALLGVAEREYAGDFLEADAYQEWTVSLREEARLVFVSVARALADAAAATGDHDAAGGYLLRILERDPYDEAANLGLTRAFSASGRHGEARRAYEAYCTRMGELDVEPAGFPAASPQSATKATPVT